VQLYELTIHEALAGLRAGSFSAVELTQAVLERIEHVESATGAYLHLAPQAALQVAARADQARADGQDGALLGIPLAIKDLICTQDMPTTCGSRILEGFMTPYDATVISRLRKAGAIILGKTNTDEFAMGSSTEASAYQLTHNPWDLTRVPGGSSGGSAAAVAAGECLGALGSDTGGSVRQPAAFCGVTGLKPTYGRVSRWGVVAYASSLDQVGTLAQDAQDCELLLSVIGGYDPNDATSSQLPLPASEESLEPNLRGMTLGLPKEFFAAGLQPGVEQAVRCAIETFSELGAEIVKVSLPHTRYAVPTYYLISTAEASANLARFDGIRYGKSAEKADDIWEVFRRTRSERFGPEVKRRIMLGTYALSAGYYDAYYKKAQQVRTLIKQDYDRAFETCTALLTPTSPTTAFKLGERIDDPLAMYLGDLCTLSLNLAGNCGISVPCGSADGLPVGLQILGNTYDEAAILKMARVYQQVTDWHRARPVL